MFCSNRDNNVCCVTSQLPVATHFSLPMSTFTGLFPGDCLLHVLFNVRRAIPSIFVLSSFVDVCMHSVNYVVSFIVTGHFH